MDRRLHYGQKINTEGPSYRRSIENLENKRYVRELLLNERVSQMGQHRRIRYFEYCPAARPRAAARPSVRRISGLLRPVHMGQELDELIAAAASRQVERRLPLRVARRCICAARQKQPCDVHITVFGGRGKRCATVLPSGELVRTK